LIGESENKTLDPGSGMEIFGSRINIPDPEHWYILDRYLLLVNVVYFRGNFKNGKLALLGKNEKLEAVLGIRIRTRIRIRMFLGLPDPDPSLFS
jgi:hypothetical protein